MFRNCIRPSSVPRRLGKFFKAQIILDYINRILEFVRLTYWNNWNNWPIGCFVKHIHRWTEKEQHLWQSLFWKVLSPSNFFQVIGSTVEALFLLRTTYLKILFLYSEWIYFSSSFISFFLSLSLSLFFLIFFLFFDLPFLQLLFILSVSFKVK